MKNVFLISVLLSALLGACTPAMQKSELFMEISPTSMQGC